MEHLLNFKYLNNKIIINFNVDKINYDNVRDIEYEIKNETDKIKQSNITIIEIDATQLKTLDSSGIAIFAKYFLMTFKKYKIILTNADKHLIEKMSVLGIFNTEEFNIKHKE